MSEPLLTREEAVEAIRRELGIPITKRRIDRAASEGTGPAPKAKYGHSFLYEKETVLAWAQTLIEPATSES